MCCTLEAIDLIEADIVVVESTFAIAVNLLGESHERAHSFLQVMGLMEAHEVGGIEESFVLLLTRVLFEGLLVLLLRIGSGFGLASNALGSTRVLVLPQMPCS